MFYLSTMWKMSRIEKTEEIIGIHSILNSVYIKETMPLISNVFSLSFDMC
jgi:hypothetical protein